MYDVMVGESKIGVKHRLRTTDYGLWTVDNEQILSMVVQLYWQAYDK